MSKNVLQMCVKYLNMSKDVSKCPFISSNVLLCPTMSTNLLQCLRMSSNVFKCPPISSNVLQCVKCTQMSPNILKMSTNVFWCLRMSYEIGSFSHSKLAFMNNYRIKTIGHVENGSCWICAVCRLFAYFFPFSRRWVTVIVVVNLCRAVMLSKKKRTQSRECPIILSDALRNMAVVQIR